MVTYLPESTRSEVLGDKTITRFAVSASTYQFNLYARSPTANSLVMKCNLPIGPNPDYALISEVTFDRIDDGIIAEEDQRPFGGI
jgi:hypothetical protein